MDRIKVGKIVGAFGIRGELKVLSYADKPHRFEELDSLYAGKEE